MLSTSFVTARISFPTKCSSGVPTYLLLRASASAANCSHIPESSSGIRQYFLCSPQTSCQIAKYFVLKSMCSSCMFSLQVITVIFSARINLNRLREEIIVYGILNGFRIGLVNVLLVVPFLFHSFTQNILIFLGEE